MKKIGVYLKPKQKNKTKNQGGRLMKVDSG